MIPNNLPIVCRPDIPVERIYPTHDDRAIGMRPLRGLKAESIEHEEPIRTGQGGCRLEKATESGLRKEIKYKRERADRHVVLAGARDAIGDVTMHQSRRISRAFELLRRTSEHILAI